MKEPICVLCGCLLNAGDQKKLTIQGSTFVLHKKCLRQATHKQLIEKGIVRPDDNSWWTYYGK